jgi:hypothetical protein
MSFSMMGAEGRRLVDSNLALHCISFQIPHCRDPHDHDVSTINHVDFL